MIDLEAIAVRRAQEQYEAGAWKNERGTWRQPEGERVCCVPGCYATIPRQKHHTASRCSVCIGAHYVITPCKGCGGRLHRRDETSANPNRRGYCGRCRADMPQRCTPENLPRVRAKREST